MIWVSKQVAKIVLVSFTSMFVKVSIFQPQSYHLGTNPNNSQYIYTDTIPHSSSYCNDFKE